MAAQISYSRPKGLIVRSDAGRTKPSERLLVEASGQDFIHALELAEDGFRRLAATHGKPVGLRVWSLAVFGPKPPLVGGGTFELRAHASARGIPGGFDFYLPSSGTARVFARPAANYVHWEPTGPGSPPALSEFRVLGAMNTRPVTSRVANVGALALMLVLSGDIKAAEARSQAAAIDGALGGLAPELVALGRQLISTICA